MNDERLTAMLGSLRHERMDRIADDKIRARLENAWSARAERRPLTFVLRRFAPVLATLVLFAGIGSTTMNAAGDSPLYGFRIAIENASIALHVDPADREAFLMQLLDQRQSEAARLEATGNAAAASKAREIERETLAMLPQAPEVEPAPLPAPTETATPSPTPSPTPAPTLTPVVAPTTTRTATPRPPTPTPTRTPTPTVRTPTPPPTPTGSAMAVFVTGVVKNSDGSPAASVCIRLDLSSPGCVMTSSTDGTYRFSISARLNQSVTFYFTRQDGSITWKAYTTVVIKSSTVTLPTVKLAKV